MDCDGRQSDETTVMAMPCGRLIDLERPRSEGVLSAEEVLFCKQNNVPLAYDPMQIGWLPTAAADDFNEFAGHATPTRQSYRHSAIAQKPQINALHPQYRLRAWELHDLDTYRALLDDPAVWKYMPEAYPEPLTPETASALIELSNASNHHQVFAVLRDSSVVGQARLLYDVDDADPGVAEISYWLGRAHWGKGIGSDIVELFISRCFADNPGIMTLIARVHRENVASSAILQKTGFGFLQTDPKASDWTILSKAR